MIARGDIRLSLWSACLLLCCYSAFGTVQIETGSKVFKQDFNCALGTILKGSDHEWIGVDVPDELAALALLAASVSKIPAVLYPTSHMSTDFTHSYLDSRRVILAHLNLSPYVCF